MVDGSGRSPSGLNDAARVRDDPGDLGFTFRTLNGGQVEILHRGSAPRS
jgi:hypothetical protein